MPGNYTLDDVVKSYRWLGHKNGFTEMNAFHPVYRPGRENVEWNKRRNAFPKLLYARDERAVTDFVKKYAGTRMVCYGINPRRESFRTNGYPRGAKETEIEVSQNVLFDLDFQKKRVSESQKKEFLGLLRKTGDYFRDLGFNRNLTLSL